MGQVLCYLGHLNPGTSISFFSLTLKETLKVRRRGATLMAAAGADNGQAVLPHAAGGRSLCGPGTLVHCRPSSQDTLPTTFLKHGSHHIPPLIETLRKFPGREKRQSP